MRFFNRKTAKQLRDDLEIFGKDRRQLHVDARVRGSSKRSRIGTFDMDSGTLTFDGTEWFAACIGPEQLEDSTAIGDEVLVAFSIEHIQSAIGRLSEHRGRSRRSRLLATARQLFRRTVRRNPPAKSDERTIAEQIREIEHLKRVINANNGLYADQIARGLMIPSVDDYPFDPKSLVRLHKGFDGVAVEMRRGFLCIDFVEGNAADEFDFASMTKRQRHMRLAISRGKVKVRLCHLVLHKDGTHEWVVTESSTGTTRPSRRASR